MIVAPLVVVCFLALSCSLKPGVIVSASVDTATSSRLTERLQERSTCEGSEPSSRLRGDTCPALLVLPWKGTVQIECLSQSHKARLGVDSFSFAFPGVVAECSGLCVFYQHCRFGPTFCTCSLAVCKDAFPPSRPEGYTGNWPEWGCVWMRRLEIVVPVSQLEESAGERPRFQAGSLMEPVKPLVAPCPFACSTPSPGCSLPESRSRLGVLDGATGPCFLAAR